MERFIAADMPCRRQLNSITKVVAKPKIASEKNSKTLYGCEVESHASTRQRVETSVPKSWRPRCMQRLYLHKFIPMPQAMKIPDAKAAQWTRNGKKARDDPSMEFGKSQEQKAWQMAKVKNKKELSWKHKERQRKTALLHWWTSVISRMRMELEPKYQKYKGRVVLRGGQCIKRLWSWCSIYWTGLVCVSNNHSKSDACHCKITWLWWTSSRLRVTIHSGEDGGRSQIAQIPESECPEVWIRLPRRKWPKSWEKIEDPVVLLERNLYGHPLEGLLWERRFEEAFLELGWGKVPNWECLFVHRKQGLCLSVYMEAGRKQNMAPMWKKLMKLVDVGEPTSFLDHVFFAMYSTWLQIERAHYLKNTEGATRKITGIGKTSLGRRSRGPATLRDMLKNALSDTVNCQTRKWCNFTKFQVLCLDDHHFKEEELESVGEFFKSMLKDYLKCLCLARIGRPDIQWSVNKLARSVTNMGSGMWQMISKTDFLHSSHKRFPIELWCGKHGTALQTGIVPRLVFCWRPRRLKINFMRIFCAYLESHTFVLVSWMCKKQNAVSHGSTESEMLFLCAGLRLDGFLALDLWDMVIEVLRSTNNTVQPKHTSIQETEATLYSEAKTLNVKRKQLSNVDHVPTNTHSSQGESQLYIFEDNEAVIKMIIKGRSPTMRHVSRTHRVALDWLFDRINLDSQNPHQMCWHQNQLADILTKGKFTRDEWNHLLRLFNIMDISQISSNHFSSTSCSVLLRLFNIMTQSMFCCSHFSPT